MTKAYWFAHDCNAKDDPKCMMMIDELGLEGYGIYWVLIETLREQKDYKYPMKMLGSLARKYATTAPKMEVVVNNYELFKIENDEFFLSESLCKRMQKFDEKREKLSLNAKIGVEKRRRKQEEQLEKLSLFDSSEQMPNKCRAKTKQNKTKQNKIKENKNTTQELEKWLEQKSIEAKNPVAYKAKIRNMYEEGVVSVTDEFLKFKKEEEEESIEYKKEHDKYIGKTITFKDSSKNIIKTKILKIFVMDEKIKVLTELKTFDFDDIEAVKKAAA